MWPWSVSFTSTDHGFNVLARGINRSYVRTNTSGNLGKLESKQITERTAVLKLRKIVKIWRKGQRFSWSEVGENGLSARQLWTGPLVARFKALLVAVQESSQLSVHFTHVKHTIDSSSRHLLPCLALADVWSAQLTVLYELRPQSGGRDARARGSQSLPGATELPEWDPRVTLNLFKERPGFGSPAGQQEGRWLRNPRWLTTTQRRAQARSQLLMTLVRLTPCQQAVGQIRLSVKVCSWMKKNTITY